jgi:amidohydrolase
MNAGRLIELARSVEQYVIDIRRELHQMPETRWEEERTLEYIYQSAPDTSLLTYCPGEGGIWFDLDVDPSYDRIIFRADVDALDVDGGEQTGLPFASEFEGKMHACGHDVHSAILLGTMKAIASGEIRPKHNLRFVFQRAEENPGLPPRPESGGEVLVKADGVLDGIVAAYGLHIWNQPAGKPGVFYCRPGAALANSGRVRMLIKCAGGHAAMPEIGSNAIDVAADLVVKLRGLPERVLPEGTFCKFAPVISLSGRPGATNVRPGVAELWFGNRQYMKPNDLQIWKGAIVAAADKAIDKDRYGEAMVEVQFIDGHPVLINTPERFDYVSDILVNAGERVETHEPIGGGEDFAHYLMPGSGRPGGFWFLGAHTPWTGDHHSGTFNPDERVFWKGVLFWLLLAGAE